MACGKCEGRIPIGRSRNKVRLYQNPRTGYKFCPYCGSVLPIELPRVPALRTACGGYLRCLEIDRTPLDDAGCIASIPTHSLCEPPGAMKTWVFRSTCGYWIVSSMEAVLERLASGSLSSESLRAYRDACLRTFFKDSK